MLKKIILALMALSLMVILSGCYRLNSDLAISAEDDTVSGTLVFAFPKSFPNEYQARLPTGDDLPPGITTATYVDGEDDDEGNRGITYTLDKVKFADLALPDANGNRLPFTITKDEEGTYVLNGDFTKWFPDKAAIQGRGLTPPNKVSKPKITMVFTFPYNISKSPEGLKVEGPRVTIERKWLETHKKFTVKAAATGEGLEPPGFEDFPSRPAADTSAYPMPVTQRNQLPNYLFGGMLGLGLIGLIYGHYASRSRGPRR